MDEYENDRYYYLRRRKFILHDEHAESVSSSTLDEMSKYQTIELYPRKRIVEISRSDRVYDELRTKIQELLDLRAQQPEGSNAECICMDVITEFLSKLDEVDFRKIPLERLL